MTREEIIKGLSLLGYEFESFDERSEDGETWFDVHEVIFEAIKILKER